MLTTTKRNDRSKSPKQYEVLYATFDECKNGSPRHAIDRNGQIASVKITSVKTWKTRPEIKVSWKFGLYEYGSEIIRPNEQQTFFVVPVHNDL